MIQDTWFVNTMVKMYWKETQDGEHSYALV